MSCVRQHPDRVVVTGMGVLCSIGADVDSFGVALRQGRSGVAAIRAAGENAPWAAAEIRRFDFVEALAWRRLPEQLLYAARRVAQRSPFPVQVAVIAALEAWERARLHEAALPPDRVGLVVAGHNLSGRYAQNLYEKFQTNPAYLPARFALHYQDTDHVATVSHILGITGEGYTVGGASASGNVGLINGCRLVEIGAVDACLVVGALTQLSPMEMQSFFNLGAMAGKTLAEQPQRLCRPFDEAHEGFVYGQGAACIVLEAERSAQRRGAAILAEMSGYDLKLDGNSLSDPQEDGEARVMLHALRQAGIEPSQVSYVNAHGTGSPLGDNTEIRALRRVFGRSFAQPWVNATKALTGHCLCAAGVVEAVATIIQIREGFVHPNINLERPIDPDCRFVGAQSESAQIEVALSNSFGFGGFNSSIVFVKCGS